MQGTTSGLVIPGMLTSVLCVLACRSCGVILYILLCGYPPFHGDNEKKIFEAVISKPVDFTSDPWPKISGGRPSLHGHDLSLLSNAVL